jgi:hypothetical protein
MDEKLCKIIEALEDQTGLRISPIVVRQNNFKLHFKTPKGNYTIHTIYIKEDEYGWFVYKRTCDMVAEDLFREIVTKLK